jgi:hypothetical protein
MTYRIPVNQCVALAKRKLMDSAYIRATQPKRADDADYVVGEAREYLCVAAEQGWSEDIDRFIADYLASPDCDFS